jgi:hypothetical protein
MAVSLCPASTLPPRQYRSDEHVRRLRQEQCADLVVERTARYCRLGPVPTDGTPEAADFEPGPGVSKAEAFHRLGHFLAQQGSAFYAYVLAFYLIWIVYWA